VTEELTPVFGSAGAAAVNAWEVAIARLSIIREIEWRGEAELQIVKRVPGANVPG